MLFFMVAQAIKSTLWRFSAAISGLGYGRNRDAEMPAKTPATGRGDQHGPAGLNSLDPTECKAALRQRCADNTTKMWPTLAPIAA